MSVIIRHNRGVKIKGTWNKSRPFTADDHYIIHGESLADVTHWLADRDVRKQWDQNSSQDSGNRPSQGWDLSAGYHGALQLAKDGWKEGTDDLDARLSAIMPASGRMARTGYSVAGSSPNVARFLSGNPNCMKRRKAQFGSAPVIHIGVNITASCAINANQMANYGTALVGLIDRLENAGKRCHVDMVNVTASGEGTNKRLVTSWNVKRAEEQVDLAAIAFSLAHPAAFRRIGFAMMERSPKDHSSYGYGYCADILPCDLIDPLEGAMLLDGVNHEPERCNDPKDALRLAVEQLNKAAVLAGHATPEAPLIEWDEADFAY